MDIVPTVPAPGPALTTEFIPALPPAPAMTVEAPPFDVGAPPVPPWPPPEGGGALASSSVPASLVEAPPLALLPVLPLVDGVHWSTPLLFAISPLQGSPRLGPEFSLPLISVHVLQVSTHPEPICSAAHPVHDCE
jgi:hypothetical protein